MEHKEFILDGVRKEIQEMAKKNYGFWLDAKLWEEKRIHTPYIYFPDSKYLIDHSEEYLSKLEDDKVFNPQPKLRSKDFGYGGIDGNRLIPYLERQGEM